MQDSGMAAPGSISYYINGLLRQTTAHYARRYLGLVNDDGENLLTDFGDAQVNLGYITQGVPTWNDVRISLNSAGPGTSPPTFDTFIGGIRAWRFDNAAPQENLHFSIQFPHGFNPDPAYGLRLHLHWSCLSDMAGAVVEWNVETAIASIGDNYPAGSTTYSNTGSTTAARQHVVTPIHTFTGFGESAVLVGKLFRTIGGADTYAGTDVYALSIDMHYVVQQLGSLEPF